MLDALELTGRARTHVVELAVPRCTLHRDAVEPFLAMRGAALADGIDLEPVSSFRDFDRQLAIWNAKFRGERPVLDREGLALDALALAPPQRIEAILAWSALPGASRHHWGSDIDVIDRAALPSGVALQLVPAEFAAGGPFERLEAWLGAHMHRFGFFRPYEGARGGVSPEPWHLSFAPVSVAAAERLSVDLLGEALRGPPIEGADAVLAALPELHARFVRDTEPPRGPRGDATHCAEGSVTR
jgi:LAS superfamily LD-carboxypeptidase LdcB